MCVVSMIGDHYHDKWADKYFPKSPSVPYMPQVPYTPSAPVPLPFNPVDYSKTKPLELATKEELEELRKEVLEMKELLKKAIAYDIANNEPHCETEEKMQTLKKVAEAVGVSLDDIL